jgi:hypothetical protein
LGVLREEKTLSDRSDWLKSLVRGAATRVGERVREQPAVAALRGMARDIRARAATIPERALSRAALRLPDVTSSSLRCGDGAIHFEAELTNGRWVHAKLFPEKPRFAGRGAKEVVFRVEPPEAAGEPVIRELIGAIAALIARALWAAVLGPMPSEELIEGAFVERDGAIAHVDLRTVPSVRKAQSGGAASTMIDTLSIERIEVGDHCLQLVIALPSMG